MDPWTLAPDDRRYPAGLADLTSPPVLRVLGTLPSARAIAIVGARACSNGARDFTVRLARELASASIAIWSGGAFGIDAAAHRGALEAGAPTVVVIGSGIAQPTPSEHAGLFDEIVARGGAIVSRLDDHAPARTPHYHARNAVLAAATSLTLVVECGLQSGALSTARHAKNLKRPLAFVPHAPWSTSGAGCIAAIKNGASVVADADDALALLGLSPVAVAPVQKRPGARQRQLFSSELQTERRPMVSASTPIDLSPEQRDILAILEHPSHVDTLCDRLGKPASTLVPALVTLALSGVVVEVGPGVFERAR